MSDAPQLTPERNATVTHATTGCVGDPFPCRGVTDPFGAEVHSPMFVPGGGAGRQAARFIVP